MTSGATTPGDTMSDEYMPRVFFDGSCPLCAREIAFYRKRKGASAVAWIDVSQIDVAELPNGLSRRDALARFHVQTAGGNLINGAAAFAHLWSALPRFRLLGKIARIPPILWTLEGLYNLSLRLRPSLQRCVSFLERAHSQTD